MFRHIHTRRPARRLGTRLVLGTACVLGLATGVEAAVLSTPLLLVDGNFISCFVSNVSSGDMRVRIEVVSYNGGILNDSGEIMLAAGQTDGRSATENARCRFTVASKNAVRAVGTVNQSGVGSTSTVEAR